MVAGRDRRLPRAGLCPQGHSPLCPGRSIYATPCEVGPCLEVLRAGTTGWAAQPKGDVRHQRIIGEAVERQCRLTPALAAQHDATDAIIEAVDKLYRRGLVTESVAALLAEIFDVPHSAALALA